MEVEIYRLSILQCRNFHRKFKFATKLMYGSPEKFFRIEFNFGKYTKLFSRTIKFIISAEDKKMLMRVKFMSKSSTFMLIVFNTIFKKNVSDNFMRFMYESFKYSNWLYNESVIEKMFKHCDDAKIERIQKIIPGRWNVFYQGGHEKFGERYIKWILNFEKPEGHDYAHYNMIFTNALEETKLLLIEKFGQPDLNRYIFR
jgi:hypothetical protein